jgi:hypothetical protein
VRVSYLAMHLGGHLAELDINPLIVLPSGQGVKVSRHIAWHVAEGRTQRFAGLILGNSGPLWNPQPPLSLGGGNR